MLNRHHFVAAYWTMAGFSLLTVGCTSVPKVALPSFKQTSPEPISTAVSGSGSFAPNEGPKNPSKVYLAYGQWQEQMGQNAEARESYGKVLSGHPKDIDALLGMARLDLAAGLMDEAEQRLKKAYKISPKDPRVLATYGNFYAAQQNWPKSVEKLEAAVKQSPDDPRFQFLLAVAYARSGNIDKSVPYFKRSLPGEAEVYFNLGYILYEQGDRVESEKYFNQALALKPELEQAQAMLDRIHGRASNLVLAKGTDASETNASGVRSIPIVSKEIPMDQHEKLTPNYPTRKISHVAPATQSSSPQPPPGLTPAQQEQWRNQQGQ